MPEDWIDPVHAERDLRRALRLLREASAELPSNDRRLVQGCIDVAQEALDATFAGSTILILDSAEEVVELASQARSAAVAIQRGAGRSAVDELLGDLLETVNSWMPHDTQHLPDSSALASEEGRRAFYSAVERMRGAIDRQELTLNMARVLSEAQTSLARVRDSAAESSQLVETSRQATGEVADVTLSAHFDEYAKRETAAADRLRLAAFAFLVSVIGFSVYSVVRLPTSTQSALAHIGVAVSTLALFGYLAREATLHRREATWADVMAIQLKTFDAFAAPMAPDDRRQLRLDFGRRTFAAPANPAEQAAVDANALDAVSDLLRKR